MCWNKWLIKCSLISRAFKIFNWCHCLKFWTYATMTSGHHTLVYSTVPSRQALCVDEICQSLDMQAGGYVGKQTGRLCCLAQARLRDRRPEPCLMTPQAHLSIATFPNTQGPLEMPQIPRSDVRADKQKGKLGKWLHTCLWSGALRVDKAFDLRELSSELWGRQQNNTWD